MAVSIAVAIVGAIWPTVKISSPRYCPALSYHYQGWLFYDQSRRDMMKGYLCATILVSTNMPQLCCLRGMMANSRILIGDRQVHTTQLSLSGPCKTPIY